MSEDIVLWQHGFVKGFKLKPYNEQLYANILGFYNEQEVEFCIRKKKNNATLESHAYYRGVILPICTQSEIFGGWSLDKIHRYFAGLFLKDVETFEIKGQVEFQERILSTSSISKKKMGEFITEVRIWLFQNGIETPEPSKN